MAKRNSKARQAQKHRVAMRPQPRQVFETRVPAPDDLDLSRQWYLVYTAPRRESRAVAALNDAGCVTFWPCLNRVTIHGKRRNERRVGTFPRYLFVSGRVPGDIRDIDGVIDVVRFGIDWASVPPCAIAAIAAFQNETIIPVAPVAYAKGQHVTQLDGPFAGFFATFDRAMPNALARILVSLFGRVTPVTTELANLQAA